jgi:hypothetical protein
MKKFLCLFAACAVAAAAGGTVFAQAAGSGSSGAGAGKVTPSVVTLTNYDAGDVEWAAVQSSFDGKSKIADGDMTKVAIKDGTITIPLVDTATKGDFKKTGKFLFIFKPKSNKNMFIKTGVKFTNGGATLDFKSVWVKWASN